MRGEDGTLKLFSRMHKQGALRKKLKHTLHFIHRQDRKISHDGVEGAPAQFPPRMAHHPWGQKPSHPFGGGVKHRVEFHGPYILLSTEANVKGPCGPQIRA